MIVTRGMQFISWFAAMQIVFRLALFASGSRIDLTNFGLLSATIGVWGLSRTAMHAILDEL